MNHDEQSEPMAESQHDESIFLCCVRLIEELNGIRIVENRSGFMKSDAMFTLVQFRFCVIPFEA